MRPRLAALGACLTSCSTTAAPGVQHRNLVGPGDYRLSLMEVLQIATRNGTRHSGLDKDLGSIETGTLTDLVVPSRNLDGISHTRSITHVVQNGVVYDGDDLSRIHPDPARAKRMSFQPSTPP